MGHEAIALPSSPVDQQDIVAHGALFLFSLDGDMFLLPTRSSSQV